MFFQDEPAGVYEVRLQDKRLPKLPDAESRFRVASQVVAFYAKRQGAEVVSWCLEEDAVIVMLQGGAREELEAFAPEHPRRERLLAEAAGEAERADAYRLASQRASSPEEALGYLDLAGQASEAARALTQRAQALD